MSAGIVHVIMTRFNLATPGRESDIRTKPGWLSRRFELFERFCLPSVGAQTRTDFTWMIYFDEGTPTEFRERIERLRSEVPFVPYYTGLFRSEGWPRSVRETLPAADWLLSTHFDNDDALASDHVERLRAAAEGALRRGALNFDRGLIRTDRRLYALTHRSNAFFSFLEPWGPEMKTCQSVGHMRIAEEGPVTQIGGGPGWLQVVHGDNVSNKVRGRLAPPEAAAGFPQAAREGLKTASAAERAAERLAMPLRALRDRISALRSHRMH